MEKTTKAEIYEVMIVTGKNGKESDLEKSVTALGYPMYTVTEPVGEMLQLLSQKSLDVVLIDAGCVKNDQEMKSVSDLIDQGRLPVIWLMNSIDLAVADRIMTTHAHGFLFPPFHPFELKLIIESAMHRYRRDNLILNAKQQWEKSVDVLPELILLVDEDYRIIRANKILTEKLGLPFEKVLGAKCYELIHGLDAPPDYCPRHSDRAAMRCTDIEVHEARLGGSFHINFAPFHDPRTGLRGYVHVLRDITAQKAAEEKIKHDHAFLQGIINGISDEVVVITPHYRVMMMNETARRNIKPGYEHKPQTCYNLGHGLDNPGECQVGGCPLSLVKSTRKTATLIHEHVDADGGAYFVEIAASPLCDSSGELVGIIEVTRDITDRLRFEEEKKKLQERIFQQKKDTAICQLAAGIAHRFNNLLMSVFCNIELLTMKGFTEATSSYCAGQVRTAAEQMAALTKQMLLYAEKSEGKKVATDLNAQIRQLIDVGWVTLPEHIQVATDFADEIWPVLADQRQIAQLFLSLITNAVEAMEANGGTICISTQNVFHGAPWRCHHPSGHPIGDYVAITIVDCGSGIPESDKDHIFEPFYTTKFLGRGMELAVADSIAQSHDGCIWVENKKSGGASFTVLLPRMRVREPVARETRGDRYAGMPCRVLIVDDELDYRSSLAEILRENGLEVHSVEHGLEAIKIFQKFPDSYDVVILDIQLKDMSGREVYRALRQISPSMRIIIATGFDRETALKGMDLHAEDGYLQKPYSIGALLVEIRKDNRMK